MSQGMPDLSALLAQAQQMQSQLESAQQQLRTERFTGRAGGDLVTATVTGAGELVEVVISPAAVDPSNGADTETLADLILAAYGDARAQSDAKQREIFAPFAEEGLAEGLGGLGLPGA